MLYPSKRHPLETVLWNSDVKNKKSTKVNGKKKLSGAPKSMYLRSKCKSNLTEIGETLFWSAEACFWITVDDWITRNEITFDDVKWKLPSSRVLPLPSPFASSPLLHATHCFTFTAIKLKHCPCGDLKLHLWLQKIKVKADPVQIRCFRIWLSLDSCFH